MIKNKIKHVDMMLLIIILIASTLSTRSTDSFKKIEIAINFIMILYIIIRLVLKKPIKIIQSKLDVFVILLVISTIIPIVTNTYISLYTTVETLLNYMTMIWIYLLAREVCLSNENNIKYIKNILIIFVIILIFIGIENISSNKIFELLDINKVKKWGNETCKCIWKS